MIKLTKLLFFCALIMSIVSCGDDTSSSDNEGLEGEWTLLEFNIDAETSTIASGLSVTSVITLEGKDLNYDVILDGSNYEASGEYSYDYTIMLDGAENVMESQTVNNANSMGTYSTTGNEMTINGSIFTAEVNGQVIGGSETEQQILNYEINSSGQLVFTQNENNSSNTGDITTTSTSISRSVWERK